MADDELIAHAIEFKSEHRCDVVFFTADTGLRLKLPAHGFKALVPPDDLMLPDELDETERENEKLKAELARHVNRLPRLNLTFSDGGAKRSLRSMRLAVDKIEPGRLHGYLSTGQSDYERYLEDLNTWKAIARSSTDFRIRLENNGSAVATNIGIVLRFPDFVLAKKLRQQPKVPNYFDLPTFRTPFQVPSESAPSYSERGDTASFCVSNLVHNRVFESDPVWLRFKDDKSIKNFSAEYEITCVEVVDPIRGQLHFTVENWTAAIRGG